MAASRDDPEIHWFDPRRRGIFPLDNFHISRSLARRIRRGGYEPRINTAFAEVLRGCGDREDTWINAEIFDLYITLHELGFAHSQEIWAEGRLIGGVYGVSLGGAFFAESMFSRETDGSKLALAHLTASLHQAGFTLFDTQYLTPHLASLGAIEVPRSEYLRRLKDALELTPEFPSDTLLPELPDS